MVRAGWSMIVASLALAACSPGQAGDTPATGAGFRIEMDEVLVPRVFEVEGDARVAGSDGAQGLWAAAPDLPRPERGHVLNLATGQAVTVPLFRATGTGIRVSRAAAEAIGLNEGARVRITAVRTEPRVLAFDSRDGLSYFDQAP